MTYRIKDPRTQEIIYYESCKACEEPLDYEDFYYSEIFYSLDDEAFHLACWKAWVDSDEGRLV